MPAGAVYVGRPTMWGNYVADVSCFRRWVETEASSAWKDRAAIDLRGKDLACWCSLDRPCHADVLLEIANA